MLRCKLPVLSQFLQLPIRIPSQLFRHDVCRGFRSGEPKVRAEEQECRPPVHKVGECERHLPLHGKEDLTPERRHLRMERFQPRRIGGGEREQIVELPPIQPTEALDDQRLDPDLEKFPRALGVVDRPALRHR